MLRNVKYPIFACLAFCACHGTMSGQAVKQTQTFALTDSKDLLEQQRIKVEPAEYKGRKCLRFDATDGEAAALIKGTDFTDGTIEADVALRVTTPPGVRMPGFIGLAFRSRPDASHYELFYIRPGNSHATDQAMRNHSAQYCEAPDFSWYKLRREWPSVYEAYADIKPETWTKLKIEVAGRTARLYLNGSDAPTLVVDGLKGEDLHGAIGLWGSPGQESYFSNIRITPAPTAPLENNGDPAGTWNVTFASDAGSYTGSMKLTRDNAQITGAWSGAFGNDQRVEGIWRNGYLELAFNAEWAKDMPLGSPGTVEATLAGWIDGDSAGGRMKLQGRADGRWMATRKK